MSNSDLSGLARLIEEHGAKLLRYCGVSVVNVIIGIGTLAFCLEVLNFSPVVANVTAWAVSTVPAYLLSRYWVWQQSGVSSVKSEIVPFWIIALSGLAFSSLAIWVAGSFTENSLVLILANFLAYGVVWVAKYIVLDRLMWRHDGLDAPITEVV